jgi:hypothetical protein
MTTDLITKAREVLRHRAAVVPLPAYRPPVYTVWFQTPSGAWDCEHFDVMTRVGTNEGAWPFYLAKRASCGFVTYAGSMQRLSVSELRAAMAAESEPDAN